MIRDETHNAISTLNGSNGSGGGGLASVLTAQNMHPLVHVSPKSIIVPVPPLQHSPTFGHCASSQTVFRLSPFRDSFTSVYRESSLIEGAGTRNQEGRLGKKDTMCEMHSCKNRVAKTYQDTNLTP